MDIQIEFEPVSLSRETVEQVKATEVHPVAARLAVYGAGLEIGMKLSSYPGNLNEITENIVEQVGLEDGEYELKAGIKTGYWEAKNNE